MAYGHIRKPTKEEIEEASLWKTWTKGILIPVVEIRDRVRGYLERDLEVCKNPSKPFYFQRIIFDPYTVCN